MFDVFSKYILRPKLVAMGLGLAVAAGLAGLSGCAWPGAPPAAPAGPITWPAPPETARVQYLGSISSPRDLPSKRSKFADFILGEKAPSNILGKPNNAILAGPKLFICDTILNTVMVYNLDNGETHVLAGDSGNGKIKQPNNIALDEQGRIYVADKERGAVLIYGPDEQFQTAWGRPGQIEPVAVTVGKDVLYVCDIKGHKIEIWDRRDGKLLRSFGGMGTAAGQFYLPTVLRLDTAGNLYVTDTGNFRVQKFSPDGKPQAFFGGHGVELGHFAWPKGMDVDGHGRIYVADARFANVQIFSPQGKLLLFFGGPGRDGGNLDLPAGLNVQPWPTLAWLNEKLTGGFDPEYLVTVVSQKGDGFINFFAVAREKTEER